MRLEMLAYDARQAGRASRLAHVCALRAPAAPQDGDAFPTFASADEQQAAAEELLQALSRAAAAQQVRGCESHW